MVEIVVKHISEYISEAVSTGRKGVGGGLSKDDTMLKFASKIERITKLESYESKRNWLPGYRGDRVPNPDVNILSKEAAEIHNLGKMSIRLGDCSIFVYDPKRREGFLVVFAGTGTGNQLYITKVAANKTSVGLTLVRHKDFEGLKTIEEKLDKLEQWLYDTPF